MVKKTIILSISLVIIVFLGQGCSNNTKNESNQDKAISEKHQENNKQIGIGETEPKNEREAADIEVIQQLKSAGSNFNKEHNIEHNFMFYGTECTANDAIEELKLQGYELTELTKDKHLNGEEYFYFSAIKPLFIKDKVIFEETYKMEQIGKKYKIEYDGWGCEIVK